MVDPAMGFYTLLPAVRALSCVSPVRGDNSGVIPLCHPAAEWIWLSFDPLKPVLEQVTYLLTYLGR
jgi:hypothetical protein